MKTGLEPCYCGHSIEEHMEIGSNGGRSPACAAEGCECMHYEADEEVQEDPMGFDRVMPASRRD